MTFVRASVFALVALGGCTTPMIAPVDGGARDTGVVSDAYVAADAGPVCPTGTVDLNRSAADGCEYTCTTTSPTDEPDATFTDANCDGIDGDVANAIFVSTSGIDTNPGTMAMPVLTIMHAITLASAAGADVYVDRGAYAESLVLSDGVGIYGGYDRTVSRAGSIPGYWDRRADATTTINGGTTAVEANAITMGAVLDRLTIHAANATTPGTPSIGVWAHASTGTLRISATTIVAGNGAAGTAGMIGTDGANGGNAGAAPAAGASSCGHAGGIGGPVGGAISAPGSMGTGATGGGSGGPGGRPSAGCNPGNAGGMGMAGPAAAVAMEGAAGDGLGALSLTAWTPSDGGIGGDGHDGAGGGGGGGGSGGGLMTGPFTCQQFPGNVGGGGGGGGCHGTAGRGGTGGGASFGVLAVNAVVVVVNDDITTGTGGAGGSGGHAGAGGTGGTGAAGGGPIATSGGGGTGGAGSPASRGGHGGGGGGGPSIVLAHGGTGSITNTTSTLTVGTGGAAGAGATPAVAGAMGMALMTHEY